MLREKCVIADFFRKEKNSGLLSNQLHINRVNLELSVGKNAIFHANELYHMKTYHQTARYITKGQFVVSVLLTQYI